MKKLIQRRWGEVAESLEKRIVASSLQSVEWVLERDGKRWKTIQCPLLRPSFVVRDVVPGEYRLILETGLIVWADRLIESDVVLPEVRLAAADDETIEPTKHALILGELQLSVFAGVASGHLTVRA